MLIGEPGNCPQHFIVVFKTGNLIEVIDGILQIGA